MALIKFVASLKRLRQITTVFCRFCNLFLIKAHYPMARFQCATVVLSNNAILQAENTSRWIFYWSKIRFQSVNRSDRTLITTSPYWSPEATQWTLGSTRPYQLTPVAPLAEPPCSRRVYLLRNKWISYKCQQINTWSLKTLIISPVIISDTTTHHTWGISCAAYY